ncbi:MAG: LacI family transcriptional regulator, partial [Moraxellaceae bacterium]
MQHTQNYTYWGELVAGMRAEAGRRDRHMLLIDNGERFHQWEKMDGALITDVYERSYGLPPLPRPPKGLPYIALLNPQPGAVSVTIDDFQGLYMLTRHLIELGHKRIAYIAAFDEGWNLIRQRQQGYLAALKDAGIESEERLMRHLFMGDLHLHGEQFEEIGQHHMERWFKQDFEKCGCTAIIAQNDATALGM